MVKYKATLAAARELSLKDRLRLAETLWQELQADSEKPELSDELRQEVARRLGSKVTEDGVIPWEEVKAHALAKRKHWHDVKDVVNRLA